MEPTQIARQILSGWKAIAHYLSVSERTAASWETEGLPVWRNGGRKGRVFAYVDELDVWLANRMQAPLRLAAHEQPIPSALFDAAKLRHWVRLMAAGVVLLSIPVVFVRFSQHRHYQLESVRPLTSDDGPELGPDLSPSGLEVAYLVNTPGGGGLSVVIRNLGDGSLERLVFGASKGFVRWSPSGDLAYPKSTVDGVELRMIRRASRAERLLAKLSGPTHRSNELDSLAFCFTPSGSLLVSDHGPGWPLRIVQIDPDTGKREQITHPPLGTPGDTQPSLSPDGSTLVFVRQASHSESDIYMQPLSGGQAHRVTYDSIKVDGLTWVDSQTLLAATARLRGRVRLWLVPLLGQPPVELTGNESNANFPTLRQTHTGRNLVYQSQTWDTNLWSIDMRTFSASPVPFSSTWVDFNPSPSPIDGRLAFVSKRSGSFEVWVADGDTVKQLTAFNGLYLDSPRWSPDGATIVFTAQREGNRDIYVVPAKGGPMRQFTQEPSEEGRASYSRDGKWVYFRSNRSGLNQIWKQPVSGGPAIQLTTQGGYEAFESPDGSAFYYVRDRENADLWMMPVSRGSGRKVLSGVRESRWWLADDGIYFVTDRTIRRLRYGESSASTVASLPGDQPLHTGFSIRRDGTQAFWTQVDEQQADLMTAILRLK